MSRRVWQGERPARLRSLDFDAAIDLLLTLNAAETLRDLSPLRSVGFVVAQPGREVVRVVDGKTTQARSSPQHTGA